jgi:hypothetical protein
MTRNEALCIWNARRALTNATAYLIVRATSAPGREPWVLAAANLRESIVLLAERFDADLFRVARDVLDAD